MGHKGRGARYHPVRGLIEDALHVLYRSGWAARMCFDLGLSAQVYTVEHEVEAAAWPAGVPPLRVAFGSDFHAGPTTDPRLLQRACQALCDARPDVLLLGGDFVFLQAGYIDPLAEAFSRVPAPLGRFAVLGNHDLWADDRHIVRKLGEAGVEVLVNRSARLPPPYDHVSICGLDDPWTGRPDAEVAFAGAGATRILLMHAPAGLLSVGARPFDLAFCGHTHGGHIALPGGVAVVAPGPLSRRYSHGRHAMGRKDQGPLLVSRGIGGIEVPLRLFAAPDVISCRFGQFSDAREAANSRQRGNSGDCPMPFR